MLSYDYSNGRRISIYFMQGCGHCHEYMPRVKRIVAQMTNQGWCLPAIEFVDLEDQSRSKDADRFKVQYAPTTVFQRPDGYWKKWEQPLSDEQLRYVLERTSRGQSCEV